MKLSQVRKIEMIRTNSGAWNAYVENGPWACYRSPEKALEKLLELLRPNKRLQADASPRGAGKSSKSIGSRR
jgi:hypothetical protein